MTMWRQARSDADAVDPTNTWSILATHNPERTHYGAACWRYRSGPHHRHAQRPARLSCLGRRQVELFFNHPGDSTPVCRTQMVCTAQDASEFVKRNMMSLGLSTDAACELRRCVEATKHMPKKPLRFPIVVDADLSMAQSGAERLQVVRSFRRLRWEYDWRFVGGDHDRRWWLCRRLARLAISVQSFDGQRHAGVSAYGMI